jgi:hypothetical protein
VVVWADKSVPTLTATAIKLHLEFRGDFVGIVGSFCLLALAIAQ